MYQKASATHLIDLDTYQFVEFHHRNRPAFIYCPFFLWHYGDKDRARISEFNDTVQKYNTIQLNNLTVQISMGWRHADIHFEDVRRNVPHKIVMNCLVKNAMFRGINQPIGAVYVADVDGGKKSSYEMSFGRVHQSDVKFDIVQDLDNVGVPKFTYNEALSFGISQEQYHVFYKGNHLNGKSYALVCGTWGILLSDHLEFDSLVYFEGVKTGQLDVEHFAYTVNPYILKMLMLR